MSPSANKLLSILSKSWLPVAAVILTVLAAWRVLQVVDAPNLLLNPDFDAGELVAWQVVQQGQARASSKLSSYDPVKTVLELNIDATPAGSWAGVGQRAAVESGQRYEAQVRYQLINGNPDLRRLILRVTQFDQAGKMLKTEESSPSGSSLVSATGGPEQAEWRSWAHTFTTQEEADAVEIGVGLFGQQATIVEVDSVALKTDLTLSKTLGQDPIIVFLFLAMVVGLGYKSRRVIRLPAAQLAQVAKARRRLIAIVAVNIVLFVALAELFALGIYFVRNETLFYLNKPTYELIKDDETNRALTPKRIHPYFGYVDEPGWQRAEDNFWEDVEPGLKTINNQGLGSDYDYPFVKGNENQYVIGIFGGSVAERFALLTRDRLIENLQQDNFFSDKEIVVLNFAKAGYKQPQQLLLLTYFLSIGQEFDLVINIDGFNEVAFSHRNYQRQVDLSMPHVNILDGLINLIDQTTLTPEKLESLAKIDAYKTRLNKLAKKIKRSNIAAITFILEQYYAIAFNNYRQELIRFDELGSNFSEDSLLFIKLDNQVLVDPILFGRIAVNWVDSSIMMSRTLADKKIAYFHFLQPNQHYSNKTFGPEEAERALEQDQPYYSTLVKTGYPYLIEKFGVLGEHNVNFYNGIPIFDQEPGLIYIDNCCHYNQLGNNILADFIATSILESGDY
jgi:hypothetical protein